MPEDRRPSGDNHTDHTTKPAGPATRGDGEKQPSAAERRAGAGGGATRDFGEQMTELDAAGTVEEQGGRARPAEREPDPDEDGRPHGVRGLVREHALSLGLAASSIALLIGARGSGEGGAEAAPPAPDVLSPPEKRAEETGPRWDLHLSEHERVDFFVEFLMGKNYDKTRQWLERIGKYGPLIQNELRERGMPQDLLYLTMIESGLNPNAYSRAHAAGLWQFIEETGRRYGLEVSSYVDERRDPIKSTAAALTYLQQMHDRFGSWYLSAAGYNTGENRVGRLMREQVGTEKGADDRYWDIWERLPAETRDYVPLMLAMGRIAKEPDRYGFHGIEYMEPLRFEEVVVPGGTKLADVARAAGVGADVIEDLNPHLVRKQTPPRRQLAIRVPVGQQQQVAAALGGEAVRAPALAD